MKVQYRGFEIDVHRENCLAGYPMLYYSLTRLEDAWEMVSSFSESADTVGDMIKDMKQIVDDYYLHPEEYEDDYDMLYDLV